MLTANPHPTGRGYSTFEFAMNIELDEVVQDVSDDALEMAAGGAQGGPIVAATFALNLYCSTQPWSLL